jgi:hypothetical protein
MNLNKSFLFSLLISFCVSCNKNSSESGQGSSISNFMKPSSKTARVVLDKVEMDLKFNEFKEKYKDRIDSCSETFLVYRGKEDIPKESVKVAVDYCNLKVGEDENFEVLFNKQGDILKATRSYAKELMGGLFTKSKGPALSFAITTFNERFDTSPEITKEEATISDPSAVLSGNFMATINTLFYIVQYELSNDRNVFIISDYFNSQNDDKDNIKVLIIKYVNKELQVQVDKIMKGKLDEAIKNRDENKI